MNREAGSARHDHGQSVDHGFQNDCSGRFASGQVDEQVRCRHDPRNVFAIAENRHARFNAQLLR